MEKNYSELYKKYTPAFYKNRIFIAGVGVVFGLCMLYAGIQFSKERKFCRDFSSRADAQAAFDADPDTYTGMDRGGEPGVVCETFPYKK